KNQGGAMDKGEQRVANFSDSLIFFFVPGVILSLVVYLGYLFVEEIGFSNWELVSALLLSGVFFMTGFLHIDGAGDVADAFFSSSDKTKILEILKDSRMGTFGVAIVVFDILIKWVCWSSLLEQGAIYVIIMSLVMGRSIQGVCLSILPNARGESIAGAFVSSSGIYTGVLFLVFFIEAAVFSYFIPGTEVYIMGLSGIAVSVVTALYFIYKIGGITGDCIGAINEVFEAGVLISGVVMLQY
ncbi:MAG: adenosylcobinamide-GDP ribazoletransferase, partial [Chitinivibrionales bacterium]